MTSNLNSVLVKVEANDNGNIIAISLATISGS